MTPVEPDLTSRIQRIYAAINAVADPDVSKVRPTSRGPGHFRWDFTLPDEQLANLAFSAIHNVASLKPHLRAFARRQRRDPECVTAAINASPALQVIIDLDDRDKHGGDRDDGGESGKNPRLGELFRGLQQLPQTGEAIAMLRAAGVSLPSPVSPPRVVVTGSVLDSQDRVIGDLVELLEEAVSVWEELLRDVRAATQARP